MLSALRARLRRARVESGKAVDTRWWHWDGKAWQPPAGWIWDVDRWVPPAAKQQRFDDTVISLIEQLKRDAVVHGVEADGRQVEAVAS